MLLTNYAAIALGGAIGACFRYVLSEWMLLLFGRAFPFGTLLVNILGAFAIGVLYGFSLNRLIQILGGFLSALVFLAPLPRFRPFRWTLCC